MELLPSNGERSRHDFDPAVMVCRGRGVTAVCFVSPSCCDHSVLLHHSTRCCRLEFRVALCLLLAACLWGCECACTSMQQCVNLPAWQSCLLLAQGVVRESRPHTFARPVGKIYLVITWHGGCRGGSKLTAFARKLATGGSSCRQQQLDLFMYSTGVEGCAWGSCGVLLVCCRALRDAVVLCD